MEVHAPEHPIHTWRDFFIHIATIVVGLLIAIGLEQSVEWLHHRHIVHVARENIRIEVDANHKSAAQNLKLLQANMDRIQQNIQTLHVLQGHPKNFHGRLDNEMDFSSFNDSAWRSARDTGALAYMPYEDVQRISDIYNQQDVVTSQAIATYQHEFLALTPIKMGYSMDTLPDSEYLQMLRDNAATLLELTTLQQLVQQLNDQYTQELKKG